MEDATRRFNAIDNKTEMKEILTSVYHSLVVKGYNPINQLVGYILSEDPTYITNYSNARSLICRLDRDELLQELLDARSIQDDTQRAAVYDHIGQVLSEERPYIPMWSYNNLVGASKTQEGFQMNPVSAYRYENVVVYE